MAGICGVWCCTEQCDPKQLYLSDTGKVFCWVFFGCFVAFFSPQMSNNFLCEQVGAANFVALWNTSRKTARRSRMLVSCRGCGMGVGQLLLCMAVVWEKALGRELGSSRADLLLGYSGRVWRRQ